jgi:hypothetical protein
MDELSRARLAPRAVLAGGGAGAAWLLVQDPHEAGHLFPRCPFRVVTGLQCPACGGTRMLYDLLHLDLAAAWRDNALLLLVTPWALLLLARWLLAGLRGRTVHLALGDTGARVVLATAVVWAVARNVA